MTIQISPQQKIVMQKTASSCAAINLRKASRVISQFYDSALEPSGLTSTQFTLLVAIAVHAPIPITQLAERLVMDRTTLTRDLQRLEDQKFVEIVPGTDRRSRMVTFTQLGQRALMVAVPLRAKAHKHVVQGIGQDRLDLLLEIIEEVVGAVRPA
jgi:DNA-binding MarR family transcriptional regulator